MLYYDQGMFEEVNYMTSAIPGRSDGRRRLDQHGHQGRRQQVARRHRATTTRPAACRRTDPKPGCLESDNLQRHRAGSCRDFLGNPTQTTYDFNVAGGGALVQDRLWVNGAIRRWIVNKLVEREERRRHAGDRRQHAEELLGQGGVLGVVEPEDVVLLQLEQQDSRPSPRHAAEHRARHRVAGPDQPGVVDAGEVHRHPQQDWCSSRRSAS